MFLWAEHHHFNREDTFQTWAETACSRKYITHTFFIFIDFSMMFPIKVMQFNPPISFSETQTYFSLHIFLIFSLRKPYWATQVNRAFHYTCTVLNKCSLVNRVHNVRLFRRDRLCGGKAQGSVLWSYRMLSPPLQRPCSGIRRHGEVLQPAVVVNHGIAAKVGCHGASIPPETQGWAGLWS